MKKNASDEENLAIAGPSSEDRNGGGGGGSTRILRRLGSITSRKPRAIAKFSQMAHEMLAVGGGGGVDSSTIVDGGGGGDGDDDDDGDDCYAPIFKDVEHARGWLVGLGGVVSPGCVGLGGANPCRSRVSSGSSLSSGSTSLRSCMSVRTLEESLNGIIEDGASISAADKGGGNPDSIRSADSWTVGGGNRSVSFRGSQLQFREFPIEVADYPSVMLGPALGIGWDPVGPDRHVALDEYEERHPSDKRRTHRESHLATYARWKILVERGGYTRKEIEAEMKKIKKARKAEEKELMKQKSCNNGEQDDDEEEDDAAEGDEEDKPPPPAAAKPNDRRGSVEALRLQVEELEAKQLEMEEEEDEEHEEKKKSPSAEEEEKSPEEKPDETATAGQQPHRRRLSLGRLGGGRPRLVRQVSPLEGEEEEEDDNVDDKKKKKSSTTSVTTSVLPAKKKKAARPQFSRGSPSLF